MIGIIILSNMVNHIFFTVSYFVVVRVSSSDNVVIASVAYYFHK